MGRNSIYPPSAIGYRRSARRRAGGFTLIEAALTTVIIGTGVLAIVAAQQAYHMQNDWAQRTGTGQHLANELRELSLTMPMYHPITDGQSPGLVHGDIGTYRAVIDFAGPISNGQGAGVTFSPPVNALRREYPLDGWSQEVIVRNVYDDWLDIDDGNAPALGSTDVMRVTVRVHHQGVNDSEPVLITQLTWVVGG